MVSFNLAELDNLAQRGQHIGLVMPQGLESLGGQRARSQVSYVTATGGVVKPWVQMLESEVKVGVCGSSYVIAFIFLVIYRSKVKG